ncbi:hypothetical protein SFSGTM_12670 [Sulfuriferula nivalis]|uniref:Uncharacterized protein n=1 Tax=Sulfuriferula nivalis TaxID=2675298 RepID=A0A809RFF5_9PROT|nr:hypothetical protein SFSGTM_12670 [Sulfuriferula nivalis]
MAQLGISLECRFSTLVCFESIKEQPSIRDRYATISYNKTNVLDFKLPMFDSSGNETTSTGKATIKDTQIALRL